MVGAPIAGDVAEEVEESVMIANAIWRAPVRKEKAAACRKGGGWWCGRRPRVRTQERRRHPRVRAQGGGGCGRTT
jgi:hypothetical protein